MSDTFDFINFLEHRDNVSAGQMRDKLADLREKRADIREETGQAALSFQDFIKEHPPEKPNHITNAVTGGLTWAAIGGTVGALLGLLTPAGAVAAIPFAAYGATTGGLVGGAVGVYSETTNTKRGEIIDQYEQYLNAFEDTAHSQSRGHSTHAHAYENHHARSGHAVREKERRAERDMHAGMTLPA